MRFDGKTVLITGAGRGIGKAMALRFAGEGANIAVNDIDPQTAKQTAEEVKKLGRKAIAVKADVAIESEVDAMMDKVIKEMGGINVLINNAGIVTAGPTAELDMKEWDRVVAVLLRGSTLCSRGAGRWMIKNGGGKIVSIASVAGVLAFAETLGYGSGKAAIINMTRGLAVEWARYNINVNCIAPGFVKTPLGDEAVKKGGPTAESFGNRVPLRRMAVPDDIAKAAMFLTSDDAAYITGVTLYVDGGFMAYGYQAPY